MRRREMVAGIGTLPLWRRSAWAQPGKTYHLGVLVNTRDTGSSTAVVKALRDRGYVEGQNLIVEWRLSGGDATRWLPLARELAALKVDAIMVETTPAALAAGQATNTIPIVIETALDPVGAGLAESLVHPGGNITGCSLLAPETTGKALSLLKQAVPPLQRVAVLWNSANPALAPVWQAAEEAARSIGLTLSSVPIGSPQDFPPAFDKIASLHPDAVLVLIDALAVQSLRQIAEFTVREHLPAASGFRPFASFGGLRSYGPSRAGTERDAADYVDKVLKGANPADLPFIQPTQFELVVNMKTASTLGLTLPPLVLAQADEVIE
jgi:putative tryptophan/tyrosine transport system substrate-binding protein